jgi:2-oxoglutarate dehydrogenase E2 component (dihydrolipoamide succinyltransferase)
MATVEIRMPSEQNEGTESFLVTWHRKPGEAVKAHEPVADITTDKVALEVAAPTDGVLAKTLKAPGDPVAPGELLALLETGAPHDAGGDVSNGTLPGKPAAPPQAGTPPPPAEAGARDLSPGVRRLVAEHGLDPAAIPVSGRGGRLSIGDVEAYLAARKAPAKPGSRFVPHSAMRRSIASHMARSLQSAPHVTAVFEADFTRVLADREARKAKASAAGDVPTLTAYLVRAAVRAIEKVPEANSRWHDDRLEIFEDANIGFGAATPDGGLIVPVIHKAQDLDLAGIASRLRVLTDKAREGKLEKGDVEGGTFTLSNHGIGGSLLAAPIVINHGQAAILGAGKLQRRPVVNPATDVVEPRPMMYITLTIDHRVLDGHQTDSFLARLVEVIEKET